MSRSAIARGVVVVGLGAWAAQQLAAGRTADGAWILAFAAVVSLGFIGHRLVLKAAILTLAALLLSVAEFTGLFVREDPFRGVLAALACLVGVYLTGWISRDSLAMNKSQH